MSIGEGLNILANDIKLAEHTGTHMDVPTQFTVKGSNQWHIVEIPAERLVNQKCVVMVGVAVQCILHLKVRCMCMSGLFSDKNSPL